MKVISRDRSRWADAGLLLLWLALQPQAAGAQGLSFEAAWTRMHSTSERLAASQAALDSKISEGRSVLRLGGPSVSVSAAAFAYRASLSVDLDPVTGALDQLGQSLPVPLQRLIPPSAWPTLPERYTYTRHDTAVTGSVSALWPVYLGGVEDAVRGVVAAQASEAQADTDSTAHELDTQLVQRYFGAQLAARGARLRQEALRTIEQHDEAARKMLSAGVISRVERLQAQAALEDARRQALKAGDDAALAAVALARTVQWPGPVQPSSPLFVLTQPVEPLAYFQSLAQERHPGLAKVAARKSEAQQLQAGAQSLRRPQIFGFAQRQLRQDNADWMAGVALRWTLFDSLDRSAADVAARKKVEQAEHTDAQARSDIALLVERQWHLLEQARRQYLALQASLDLSAEVLRLRRAGLREGTSTSLELIDAEVNQLKVQTERSQAAYDYVVALAALLESCGVSDEFSAYMARADVKVQ